MSYHIILYLNKRKGDTIFMSDLKSVKDLSNDDLNCMQKDEWKKKGKLTYKNLKEGLQRVLLEVG